MALSAGLVLGCGADPAASLHFTARGLRSGSGCFRSAESGKKRQEQTAQTFPVFALHVEGGQTGAWIVQTQAGSAVL